uniref:Addiction module component n=1 Tax=Candidatus Kentrum sp. TC TaxID=2126339 RepID=A0A450YZ24_9GAMM|nr:MAG: Putative addiction module component [Candidatus Kentron sp. TC]
MKTNLLQSALEIPEKERVIFTKTITADIDRKEQEIRQSWIEELKTRMKATNEGKANLLDFEDLYGEVSDT